MGFLRWLRIGASNPPTPKPVKRSDFMIEHYPITGRFYPKYKGSYIKRRYDTGIYELLGSYLFAYADFGRNEQDADRIIALFKEQRLKENVKVIQR